MPIREIKDGGYVGQRILCVIVTCVLDGMAMMTPRIAENAATTVVRTTRLTSF